MLRVKIAPAFRHDYIFDLPVYYGDQLLDLKFPEREIRKVKDFLLHVVSPKLEIPLCCLHLAPLGGGRPFLSDRRLEEIGRDPNVEAVEVVRDDKEFTVLIRRDFYNSMIFVDRPRTSRTICRTIVNCNSKMTKSLFL